jgi:hypothetical protein
MAAVKLNSRLNPDMRFLALCAVYLFSVLASVFVDLPSPNAHISTILLTWSNAVRLSGKTWKHLDAVGR